MTTKRSFGVVILALLGVVIGLLGARGVFGRTLIYRMEGQSMYPTIHNGQRLRIDTSAYRQRQPRRGDIILFWGIPAHLGHRYLVKRVIGLPGEQVSVRNRRVYINGHALTEPYVRSPASYFYPPALVPPNDYFVLGDNRNNSLDSHLFGMLPTRDIVGRVLR